MHAKVDFGLNLEANLGDLALRKCGAFLASRPDGPCLAGDQELSAIQGWVADSGEGRWTVAEAIDIWMCLPRSFTLSLQQRFISRQHESYAAKLLAAMRNAVWRPC